MKKRGKSLEGWAYREWQVEFAMRRNHPYAVDIPGIYSKLTKDDIESIGSAGKVRVRITIEEV